MNRIYDNVALKVIIGAITVIVIWELIPRIFSLQPSVFPSFFSVMNTVFLKSSIIVPHLIETLEESVLAFLLAVFGAGLLAILMEESKLIQLIFLYPTIALQNTPKVAFAPLLVILLKYGKTPKIAMGLLIAFFPIFIGFRDGLDSNRTGLRNILSVLGPSRWNLLIRVKIPEAIPNIFQGLRVGITFSIIGAIVGEMAQPSHGLGFLIEQGKENFDTNLQFASVLIISIMGLILYGSILLIERSPLFKRYRISHD